MSEKKVVSQNVVIALGIIAIIFLIGLVGAIANYTSIVNNKDSTIQSKDSQISSLNAQIVTLQNQITDLQNQIDTLKAPKLIKVHLMSDDNRPWLGTPYLHVYGYVCNVGTYTAYS